MRGNVTGSPYSPSSSSEMYRHYYARQAGQGLKVFKGRRTMSGHGFGGVLKSLFSAAKPFLKTAGKSLLNTGLAVAKDAVEGKNIANSAKARFAASGRDLLNDVTHSFVGDGSSRKRKASSGARVSKRRKQTRGGTNIFK